MLDGPVILEEAGSTTWVSPTMSCEVDAHANLIIHTNAGTSAESEVALAQKEA
jgi:hypothetical protein